MTIEPTLDEDRLSEIACSLEEYLDILVTNAGGTTADAAFVAAMLADTSADVEVTDVLPDGSVGS